jgi:hypothetical protein
MHGRNKKCVQNFSCKTSREGTNIEDQPLDGMIIKNKINSKVVRRFKNV